MSSVTRFLRQIPVGSQYYNAPATNSAKYYEFVAAAANYTANYFPGAMVEVTSSITLPSGAILRDMGKTVTAPIAASVSATDVNTAIAGANNNAPNMTVQKYREFQVPVPTLANGTTTADVTSGVFADLVAGGYAPYNTLYLPITVVGQGVFTPGLYPLASAM